MNYNQITLEDLNFYYPYLRELVEANLKELNQDYTEELLSNNIRLMLSAKMKNTKELKLEISSYSSKFLEGIDVE